MASRVFMYKKTISETLPSGISMAGASGKKGNTGESGKTVRFSINNMKTTPEINSTISDLSKTNSTTGDLIISPDRSVFYYDSENDTVKYIGHIDTKVDESAAAVKYVTVKRRKKDVSCGFPTNKSYAMYNSQISPSDFVSEGIEVSVSANLDSESENGSYDIKYNLICLLKLDVADTKTAILNDGEVYSPNLSNIMSYYKKIVFEDISKSQEGSDDEFKYFISPQSADKMHPFYNGLSSRVVIDGKGTYLYSKKSGMDNATIISTSVKSLNGQRYLKTKDLENPPANSTILVSDVQKSDDGNKRCFRGGDAAYFSSFKSDKADVGEMILSYVFDNPENQYYIESVNRTTGEVSIVRTDVVVDRNNETFIELYVTPIEITSGYIKCNLTMKYYMKEGQRIASLLKYRKSGSTTETYVDTNFEYNFTFEIKTTPNTEYIIYAEAEILDGDYSIDDTSKELIIKTPSNTSRVDTKITLS